MNLSLTWTLYIPNWNSTNNSVQRKDWGAFMYMFPKGFCKATGFCKQEEEEDFLARLRRRKGRTIHNPHQSLGWQTVSGKKCGGGGGRCHVCFMPCIVPFLYQVFFWNCQLGRQHLGVLIYSKASIVTNLGTLMLSVLSHTEQACFWTY